MNTPSSLQKTPSPASGVLPTSSVRTSSASTGKMWLAGAAILLVALNLRTSVAALSPIYALINQSMTLSLQARNVIGMLPTAAFAVFGVLALLLRRILGMERGLVLAMLLVCVGDIGRGWLSHDAIGLGLFSIVTFAGMGIANVLLPATIKRYLPERVGIMTGLYTVMTAVGAGAPSLLAVPVAHSMGWRFSVGMWAVPAIIALLPWFVLGLGSKSTSSQTAVKRSYAAWRWPVSWAVTLVFAGGAGVMYATIAWLPTMLTSTAGVSPATAGLMLSIYNLVGLVHSFVVPNLMTKIKRPIWIVWFATVCIVVGSLGLAYFPALDWFWIIPAGLGAMPIVIGLTLLNLRAKTSDGTAALSGFMQGAGYVLASGGPLLFGEIHRSTGGWIAGCWFLAIVGVIVGVAGIFATRQVYLEDM